MEHEDFPQGPWLTIEEAASRLRLSPKTLRNYISRGVFPVHQNPETGTRRVHVKDCDEWLQAK
jgi:excisionase family DNA binding protein